MSKWDNKDEWNDMLGIFFGILCVITLIAGSVICAKFDFIIALGVGLGTTILFCIFFALSYEFFKGNINTSHQRKNKIEKQLKRKHSMEWYYMHCPIKDIPEVILPEYLEYCNKRDQK